MMQNIIHINDDDRNRTAAGHDGAAIYLGNAVYRDSLLNGLIVCKHIIIVLYQLEEHLRHSWHSGL